MPAQQSITQLQEAGQSEKAFALAEWESHWFQQACAWVRREAQTFFGGVGCGAVGAQTSRLAGGGAAAPHGGHPLWCNGLPAARVPRSPRADLVFAGRGAELTGSPSGHSGRNRGGGSPGGRNRLWVGG